MSIIMRTVFFSFLSQLGSIGINPASFSALAVVPDLAPPLRGATGGVGAAILISGRLTDPPGVVPPLQEETPPPNVSLHVVAYDRFGVVRISGSHVPGLGVDTFAISSGIGRLGVHGLFFSAIFIHCVTSSTVFY